MSLQALANNMASQGRGPDSMLVHMAPREVAGLQSLAMAHGGSLTINPTTGLPEAGFLSNLLPTLIGAGLSIASGGALTPLMAAGITGAGYGVASGSLKKGLMAGLGAYGGAGLGSGLSAAGAAEASIPGAAPVSPEAASAFTTDPSAYSKFAPTESSFGAFGEAKGALTSAPTGGSSLFGAPTDVAGQPLSFEAAAPAPTTPMAAPAPAAAPTAPTPAYGTESARNAFQSQAADATMTDNFKQAGRGLKSLVDSPAGRDAFLGTAAKDGVEATGVGGLSGLAKYGTAAIANPLLTPPSGSGYKADSEQYKYEYDVGRNPDPQGSYTGAPTGERQWFAPKFTRLYAEGGKTQTSEEARNYLMSTDPTGKTNDLTGASRQAYDYLMGNGPGYRPQIQTKSSLPEARILDEDGNVTSGPATGGGITTLPTTNLTDNLAVTSTGNDDALAESANATDIDDATTGLESQAADNALAESAAATDIDDATIGLESQAADNALAESAAATDIDDAAIGLESQAANNALAESANATDIDNSAIAVDVPNNGVTAMDDGTTQVVMDQIAQQQPTAQTTVQETPDGGAVVTMPDQTPIDSSVADTFNPDTGTYVEVGNAGGDFGDRGFEQSDDFGKYGLGVSDFGGGGGGGGGGKANYLEDLSNSVFDAANGGMTPYSYATGGISNLGGYSDGGRLLKGPGDGVSDSIPAMIGKKQPARLADGEFVIPARIVSELGNGSTDAGARKLYQMMDRIQAARKKTTGKNRVAVNSRADKMMPV